MSECRFPVRAEQNPFLLYKDSIQLAPAGDAAFAVARVAHERWGAQRLVRRRAFRYCFVGLVMSGRGRLLTTHGEHDLVPGRVFSFLTGHDFIIRIASTLQVRLAVGWGTELRRWADAHLGTRPGSWQAADALLFERILVSMLEAARARGPFSQADCDDYFRILLRAAHLGRVSASSPARGALATFMRAKAIIDRDPLQAPPVAELAHRLSIGRSHLSRLFMRFGGSSPAAYATRHRLAQAADLLAAGTSVGATAAACGYADAFGFSKAFRRHYGVPPSHWLRAEGSRARGNVAPASPPFRDLRGPRAP